MTTEQKINSETEHILFSKLKRFWRLAAIVVIVGVLVLGEHAYQSTKQKGWTTLTRGNRLSFYDIQSVAVVPDNVVLVGTYYGVSRFDANTWPPGGNL